MSRRGRGIRIHFVSSVSQERGACGADVRRGGWSVNPAHTTCRRCKRTTAWGEADHGKREAAGRQLPGHGPYCHRYQADAKGTMAIACTIECPAAQRSLDNRHTRRPW